MDSPQQQQDRGSWNEFKGRLKESWGALTDDDLDRNEGRRDQLIGQIQQKTGETREDIQRKIDRLASEAKYRI